MFVRDCLRCYTSDYTVVEHKFRAYSGSSHGRERLVERLEKLHAAPRHQYEVDEPCAISTEELSAALQVMKAVCLMSSSLSHRWINMCHS